MHQPPTYLRPPHDGPAPHPQARAYSPVPRWAPQTPPSPPAGAGPVQRRLAVVAPPPVLGRGPAPELQAPERPLGPPPLGPPPPVTVDVEKHTRAAPVPAEPPPLPSSASLPSSTADGSPGTAVAEPAGERPGLHRRLRAAATEAAGELRFVSERPNSLLDHLAYARSGEWTDQIDGQRRHLALLYVWLIAIPISTLAYAAVWASGRPGRFASMLAVALLAGTALDAIPVVEWFVPDWASLTYWPPLAWF